MRRPRAAMLSVQVEISLRDGIGVEAAVGTARRETLRAARWFADTAVDHHLGDVDILRLKFPGHALDQTGQSELAHGKGRGVCVAFNARGSAGKQNRAVSGFDHSFCRRLSDEESAVTGHYDRFTHLFG